MCTFSSHASPLSMRTNPSRRLARPLRTDLISVPVSIIPASYFSSMKKSWYARRLAATSRSTRSRSGIAQHLLGRSRLLARQLHEVGYVTIALDVPAQDLHAATRGRECRTGPGLLRAHPPIDLDRAHVPLQLALILVQFRRDNCARVVLRLGAHLVEMLECLHQHLGANPCEAASQLRGVLAYLDRRRTRGKHRTVVELFIHLHDRHPCLAVAGQDCASNGRRAPPPRQKRRMHVDRAEPWYRQDRGRNDLTKCDHHQEVRQQGAQPLDRLGVAYPFRLIDRQPQLMRSDLDCRRLHLHTATGGTVGLRDHEQDLMPCAMQRSK